MMYFLAFMLFVATLTPSYAQMSCSCTCCVGINCSPSNVGSASASDCNSCDAACSSAYSSCPSSGQSGTVSTSCSSGGGSPPPSTSANWAGTYSVAAGCDTNTCCCLTGDVVVTQSGLDISITGSVEGNCGGVTSWNPRFTLSSSTTTSASFSYLGDSYQVSKNGNQVTVNNLSDSRCSGQGTCTSGPCSSASLKSASIFAILTVVAGLLVF